MNTEKLEKLKKSLDNKFIPDNMKDKIRAEIKKLEADIKTDETITATEVKEEVKEIEKKVEEALEVAEEKKAKAPAKRTTRKPATRKPATRKPVTSRTKTPKVEPKPKSTKKSVFSIAKEIRKDNESWEDAKQRARKTMKSETTETKKKVRTETSKLLSSIRRKKELKGLTSNIKRDINRTALPKGKRISENGKVYYEYRDDHSDRLAPSYKDKIYLAEGGGVGKMKKPTLKKGDVVFVVGRRWFDRVNGNTYHTSEVEVNGKYVGKSRMTYGYGDNYLETAKEILLEKYNFPKGMRDTSPLWQLREYGVTLNKTVSDGLKRDLAEGGTIIGTPETPLARGLDIDYTTLVGETDAMSSGEMFADGGAIENQYQGRTPEDVWNSLSVEQRKHFLKDHRVFVSLAEDKRASLYRYDELPKYLLIEIKEKLTEHIKEGQYAKGGAVTNERRHVNKSEDYEVRYAKSKPSRKGYKVKRSFDGGGEIRRFDRQAQMDSETREEILDVLSESDTPKLLTNYLYGLFDGYDYSETANFKKEVEFLKRKNPKLHQRVVDIYKKIDKYKFEKYQDNYATGGGIEDNAPSVYIADLEAYNNGRLVGKWFNLLDYSDADELMEDIQEMLKESGGGEYAVHDFENLPRSMYSEYMGVKDFEEIYQMIDLAKDKDLPLEVVMEVVNNYTESAVDEYNGVYDSEEDFAEQLVDDLGIESFNNFEYYLEISDTDRRLLAQDMADSYVDDIRDEDGGNRLIEEAGLDVDEYEEADSDKQEEMLDEAREIVYDEYYNTWYDGLDDPYNFLVEEQGIYGAEDFANASFVRVDTEKLARDLEQDYTFVRHDGQVYVFNIR